MFGSYRDGDYAVLRLPPQQVVKACRAFIEARKTRIYDEREELIAEIQKRPLRQWPRFWIKRFPNRTEAIMIAQQDGDMFGSSWDDIETTGFMQASRVENLLKIAHVARAAYEPYITLSERAIRDIGNYL